MAIKRQSNQLPVLSHADNDIISWFTHRELQGSLVFDSVGTMCHQKITLTMIWDSVKNDHCFNLRVKLE